MGHSTIYGVINRVCPEGADKEHGVPAESDLGASEGYPTGNH